MKWQKRYKRINTCAECMGCESHTSCNSARANLRAYDGIRFTSDGFDCALPVAIDSHSHCSYNCLYCFADNLIPHRQQTLRPLGQTLLRRIENIFSGRPTKEAKKFRKALKYNNRNEGGYPCPVQLGAICEPCDNIERQQGWLLEYMKLAIKYNQPTRISTKGILFQLPEYQKVISKAPHLFWVAFSIITPDDELIERIDERAPNATERLKTMKILSDLGVNVSLRMRPVMPKISDATPKYPQAYKTLIDLATEAGSKAVSYETVFVPGIGNQGVRDRWKKIEDILEIPIVHIYRNFGKISACIRPPYVWTEHIMHAIRDHAHKNGLVVGVSDPVWKQLTDVGCCCGIPPDDPVFGNWERENATNAMVVARDTGKQIYAKDVIPPWAYGTLAVGISDPGVGPKVAYIHRHQTWADKLLNNWNNIRKDRSPLNYFQGAMKPIRENGHFLRDKENNLIYEYMPLERKNPISEAWSVLL